MVLSFLSVMWCGEAFHGIGVQDVESLIVVNALFPLDRGRRREGKKKEKENKITMGKEGFPGAGPASLLVMYQIAAVM
jgi:hypothetical protein